MPTYTEADYERDAAETLSEAVVDALGPEPAVPVITRLIEGRPAVELTGEAEDAEFACGQLSWPR